MTQVTYDTITDVVSDDPVPFDVPNIGECGAFKHTYAPPAVPVSEVKSYVPVTETSWKYPKDDPDSFTAIKKSGRIKMSPYNVGKIKDERFLISYPNVDVTLGHPHCPSDGTSLGEVVVFSRWSEQFTYGDCGHLENVYGSPSPFEVYQHETAKANAMSDCVSEAYSALDALTNAAEGPETVEFIISTLRAVRNPIATYQKMISDIKKSPLATAEQLSDAWLAYRYAVMPIILTVNDAMKLLEERGFLYTASRGMDKVVHETFPPLLDPTEGRYVTYNVSGETVYRATCKSRYSSSGGKLWSQSSINPFLTAWELLPLSFVADWFINIGDVILGLTFDMKDPSVTRNFCISTKVSKVETWTHHRNELFLKERDYTNTPLNYVMQRSESFSQSDVMRRVTTQTYKRELFQPSDIPFALSFDLSWMQKIDALALSLGPVLDALRGLKLIR